jgi:hypothetical protein
VAPIDFITALGRLLRDGLLRDAFHADPRAVAAQMDLRESDRDAFVRLNPEDLEFQAGVLIRKRFDTVQKFTPETFRRLGCEAWPRFSKYARSYWPAEKDSITKDAYEFCRNLLHGHQEFLCEAEWNRFQFIFGRRRFAVFCVRGILIRHKRRTVLQVFVRSSARWHERLFFMAV